MTKLEQLQRTGIHRVGTKERGFRYQRADLEKVSGADLKRIRELKIPPAWGDVWINSIAGGAVQAIGRDAAGRLQYLYHVNHTRRQDAKKFKRVIKFAEALPKMRATIRAQIKQPGLGKEPVIASISRIL